MALDLKLLEYAMPLETVTRFTPRVKRAEKYQSLNQVIKRDSLSASNKIPIGSRYGGDGRVNQRLYRDHAAYSTTELKTIKPQINGD